METWSKLLKGVAASECLRSINADVYIRYVYTCVVVVYRQARQKISVLKKPSYTLAGL
ncbi:hypothetical protein [Lactobacillus sp. ESL0679]|uniref:hypothetical protein n=1 Tax=Lactobacillus sp. ESL0679 TaxID=2983209 RepID=UPI0032AF932A